MPGMGTPDIFDTPELLRDFALSALTGGGMGGTSTVNQLSSPNTFILFLFLSTLSHVVALVAHSPQSSCNLSWLAHLELLADQIEVKNF